MFSTPTVGGMSASLNLHSAVKHPPKMQQFKLYGNEIIEGSADKCHVAIADFICGNALHFSITECLEFRKMIQVAHGLGNGYPPPDLCLLGGRLMDSLFRVGFTDLMLGAVLIKKINFFNQKLKFEARIS